MVAARWSPVAISVSMVLTLFCFSAFALLVFKKELKTRVGPLLKCFVFPLLSSLFMLAVVALVRSSIGKTHACVVRRGRSRRLHFDGTLRKT